MDFRFDYLRQPKGKRFLLWGAIMLLGLIALGITMLITRGQSFNDLLYCNPKNSFYDFTVSILLAKDRHDYGGNYPPLIQLFFWLLAHFLPPSVYKDVSQFELINLPLGATYTLLFFIVCAVLFAWLLADTYSAPKPLQRFAVFALLFSVPFIYGFQRGNVLFICLPLLLYYCANYDSPRRRTRVLACICLAIAAGIKLYPALLGLMLPRIRRWKETFLSILLGVLSVVIPSFFFDGFRTLRFVAQKILTASELFNGRGLGHQVGFANFIGIVNRIFGLSLNETACLIVMAVLTLVFFLLVREKWAQLLMLTAAMISWPSFSFVYTMIFMTLPLIAYLNSDAAFSWRDIVYSVLFAGCFVVIPFGGQNAFSFTADEYYMLNISTLVENICMNALVLLVGMRAVIERIRALPRKRSSHAA